MRDQARPLAIVGCGAHGRVVLDIARALEWPVWGFIDDRPEAAPGGWEARGPVEAVAPALIASHSFVVAIGDAAPRRRMAEFILSLGGELATLVHPRATVAPDVTLGAGTVVMAGAVINTGGRVGRFVVINTGAIVDHDGALADNVQIAPGCALAGRVTCEADVFVGTGATLIPGVTVGAGAYVAAGATVIHPVPPGVMVAGCPASVRKHL
jgi:sugar O-acyltransferase (sialic acid O-acetyltransferase NeuD family)